MTMPKYTMGRHTSYPEGSLREYRVTDDHWRTYLENLHDALLGCATHRRESAGYLTWQAITVFAPIALDAAKLHDQATLLRKLGGELDIAIATTLSTMTAEVCTETSNSPSPIVSTAALAVSHTADAVMLYMRGAYKDSAIAAAMVAIHAKSEERIIETVERLIGISIPTIN